MHLIINIGLNLFNLFFVSAFVHCMDLYMLTGNVNGSESHFQVFVLSLRKFRKRHWFI
jgi:hypothetical protein